MKHPQTVFVVDDDPGMRKSVSLLLKSAHLEAETFASAREFLGAFDPQREGCLILDLRMPEISGIELQEELLRIGSSLPIIVVSGHASVSTAVRSMKLGSFEFLEKPYSPEILLERVSAALELDQRSHQLRAQAADSRSRLDRLTPKERQILAHVVSGKTSKQIAERLGLSVSTIDNHRANLMKKLRAETAADLTRIALTADPSLARPSN